jgi:hypothetical protein
VENDIHFCPTCGQLEERWGLAGAPDPDLQRRHFIQWRRPDREWVDSGPGLADYATAQRVLQRMRELTAGDVSPDDLRIVTIIVATEVAAAILAANLRSGQ